MQNKLKAFTLIELLVVVAIIALLISILAPSLTAARRSAKTVLCASNLRQVAIGWSIYAQDNRDIAVANRPARLGGDDVYFVGNGHKYRPRWFVTLGAAVEIYAFNQPSRENIHQSIDNRLLVCPQVNDWTSERNTSYGYNYQFLGNARRITDGSRFRNFPVTLDRLLAGQTVMAADSLGTAADFAAGERTANRPDGSNEATAEGNHAYMLDPPRLTPEGDFCDGGKRSAPDARHAGRANFAYTDGHVSALQPEKVGYRFNPDGSYQHTSRDVTNRYFSGTGRDDDPPKVSGR